MFCCCVDSLVVARGLSCPTDYGILVPRSGIQSKLLALQGRFLTTGPPGKSHRRNFKGKSKTTQDFIFHFETATCRSNTFLSQHFQMKFITSSRLLLVFTSHPAFRIKNLKDTCKPKALTTRYSVTSLTLGTSAEGLLWAGLALVSAVTPDLWRLPLPQFQQRSRLLCGGGMWGAGQEAVVWHRSATPMASSLICNSQEARRTVRGFL